MGRFTNAVGAAVTAFRKEFLAPGSERLGRDVFDSWDARLVRYALYEAYCGGSPYDGGPGGSHRWADGFKGAMGLYRHTRPVYNPGYCLAEFWAQGLFGGPLDKDAGDGGAVASAIPIEGASAAVRAALGPLWRASKLARKKALFGRQGAKFGDAPILLEDDPAAGRLALRFPRPGAFTHVSFDAAGRVLGYILKEARPDPRQPAPTIATAEAPIRTVTYGEVASLDAGGAVRYATYLDGGPWNWRGDGADGRALPSEWEVAYGFVPLVWAQHLDVGRDFGASELAAALWKGMEADDLGSKLNDQIRVLSDPKWFYSGVTPEDMKAMAKAEAEAAKADPDNPHAGRASMRIFSAKDPASKAQALVADMKLAEASAHVATILDSQLRDFPELRYDRLRGDGKLSGEALREARKPVEAKVQERRTAYDEALLDAFRMALAVGGWRARQGERGYDAYAGFDLDDYHADGGPLAMAIGHRPAVALDVMDRLAEDAAEAQAVKAWTDAGVPLRVALGRVGWGEKAVEEAVAEADARAAKAADDARRSAEAEAKAPDDPQPRHPIPRPTR